MRLLYVYDTKIPLLRFFQWHEVIVCYHGVRLILSFFSSFVLPASVCVLYHSHDDSMPDPIPEWSLGLFAVFASYTTLLRNTLKERIKCWSKWKLFLCLFLMETSKELIWEHGDRLISNGVQVRNSL